MTLISLFGLWTGDNQYCQDNCEENADFSDLNVKAMEVNGRFYVGQNNSLDCRIWSSKNPKKLHMRQRRASINNLGIRKFSVQLTGFFHHFFWPAWLPLCGLASFYCMFISFGPDPASLRPTGPYEINMQKNWLGHIKEVSPARKSEKTLSAAQKTFFFRGFLDLVSPLAHK